MPRAMQPGRAVHNLQASLMAPGHDPSRWRDRLLLAGLAAIGLAISCYLAAVQVGIVPAAWDPFFGRASSARVLHSALSRALPVPDALLGALGYAGEISLGLTGRRERFRTAPWAVLAFGALAAAMALVGLGLVAVQATLLHAWCTLCLGSALVSWAVAAGVVAGGEIHAALRTVFAGRKWRHASWP
ncbi:MAG TPA: vitamin K epoxide reductase family protein [Anaeromyxobacter sp.]|nr:vitamin K epoxide reductase family protein [Anaeromyxobacter sp.]